ncbi:MAG: bifunctional glutamate N-acetyltransferase/amino-acid acetyltransferase ArgJ [Eubacteriales bacterium]|jgi:glutamate N-acetyltransferase/amino-acid N-acetyltransferase
MATVKVRPGEGGVTAPNGFQAIGGSAGIKKNNTKDMALIYSVVPCVAAGTFTTNQVKAAPVKWDQHIVYDCPTAQAVVVNSGIANAATGKEGDEVCRMSAEAAAEALNIPADSVLLGSTGVIGQQIPIDKIRAGISRLAPLLSNSREAASSAEHAIMTTDTKPKEVSVTIKIGGVDVTIGGMCKGAGMIHPNMCTMLSFITTDAMISKKMLQKALSASVGASYNMISVDGDMSTNDTCLVMANGLAGNEEINAPGEAYDLFAAALFEVNKTLAKMIAGDGEGASRLFEVRVINAKDYDQARILAKSVVESTLTKAAIFGRDANWGRILCAMGYSSAKFNVDTVDLYFQSRAGKIQITENSVATDYSEEEATRILSEDAVTAIIDIKMGEAEATAWGCDLTYDYVKINADYRS